MRPRHQKLDTGLVDFDTVMNITSFEGDSEGSSRSPSVCCSHRCVIKTDRHVSTVEELKFCDPPGHFSVCSGLLLSPDATNFVRVRDSQQKVFRQTLQCATERRVCCEGVGDPHHGQAPFPGDSGRARRGVYRGPDRHRDVQPTRGQVLFPSLATVKSRPVDAGDKRDCKKT